MPPEILWYDEKENFQLEEDIIDGVPVQVMVMSDKNVRIERILSTNPQDYLKMNCQPGAFLQMNRSLE